jgi:eukaryotic-like serine/threonine-protein kinase
MAIDAARAKTLFLAASDKPDGAERAAFLERECGGDAELRDRVEALLRANDASPLPPPTTEDATVDSNPGRPAAEVTDVQTLKPELVATPVTITADYETTAQPNVLIAGRYLLREKIGEGGMGEVWVAKQTEPIKRKVALKLIKTGMDSRAVLQRFQQERQALAMMDHPNIATVLDAGLTHTGQPFFVMELVNGLPLTKFCDELKLAPKTRLELFVPICQAVQHAHQKGIVHRDLKPANILVTMIDAKPVPKVIDFGVAKATAGNLTNDSLSTQFGAVIGTLEYMSPEQAGFSGEDIDTRADIYSLGVILYELLTGLRPIDAKRLKQAALAEMLRLIREEEPSKPSTRLSTDDSLPSLAAMRHTEPRKLMSMLRGELDWVVMKCLEKHRERRYETANALARDVQRYLADEAVEARSPTAGYRFGKFVRRHKGQVIAASLVLTTVLGGLAVVATVQSIANARLAESLRRETSANEALNEANGSLNKSRAAVQARYELAMDAIKTFHTGVSEDFLIKEEKFKSLRNRLLNSASEFYRKLAAHLDKETDVAARRALWKANFELADLTAKVGRRDDALAISRQVLNGREKLAIDFPSDPGIKLDVGNSLGYVAWLLEQTGAVAESEATYRRAEERLVDLTGTNSEEREARAALANFRTALTFILDTTGRRAEALSLNRLVREDLEKQAAAGATPEILAALARTLRYSAVMVFAEGKGSEAEEDFRKSLALWKEVVKRKPDDALFQEGLAEGHERLGMTVRSRGKTTEAERELREAIALRQKLVDEHPSGTGFRSGLCQTACNLGFFLLEIERAPEGEVEIRKALELARKLVDENPSMPDSYMLLGWNHMALADALSASNKWLEAETEYRNSLEVWKKLTEDNPARITYLGLLPNAHACLGSTLTWIPSKYKEAEEQFRQGIHLGEELVLVTPNASGTLVVKSNNHTGLAEVMLATGRLAEAEAEFRKAGALLQKLTPDNKEVSAYIRSVLARNYDDLGDRAVVQGRTTEAHEDYKKAVALSEGLVEADPSLVSYQNLLSRSLHRRSLARNSLGDTAGAADDVRRALQLYDERPARKAESYFEAACCHAALAGLAGRNGSGISTDEGKAHADQAMALLRHENGYREFELRTAPALAPLRERDDFKELLAKAKSRFSANPEKKP